MLRRAEGRSSPSGILTASGSSGSSRPSRQQPRVQMAGPSRNARSSIAQSRSSIQSNPAYAATATDRAGERRSRSDYRDGCTLEGQLGYGPTKTSSGGRQQEQPGRGSARRPSAAARPSLRRLCPPFLGSARRRLDRAIFFYRRQGLGLFAPHPFHYF